MDQKDGKLWVSEDVDPTWIVVFTLTLKDHQPNTMFLKTGSKNNQFKVFVENFKLGNVRFENMNVKNITYEVIKMAM